MAAAYNAYFQSYNQIPGQQQCGGVIIPTPFWTFGNDLLYRARIAFLWGATAISKNEV